MGYIVFGYKNNYGTVRQLQVDFNKHTYKKGNLTWNTDIFLTKKDFNKLELELINSDFKCEVVNYDVY